MITIRNKQTKHIEQICIDEFVKKLRDCNDKKMNNGDTISQ